MPDRLHHHEYIHPVGPPEANNQTEEEYELDLAMRNPEEREHVAAHLHDSAAEWEYFYQSIKDNSMACEGICKGMRVLVRKQYYCQHGKIGAVIVDGTDGAEVALKRVHYEGDTVVLKDSNGSSRPFSLDEVILLGQVTKVEFDV